MGCRCIWVEQPVVPTLSKSKLEHPEIAEKQLATGRHIWNAFPPFLTSNLARTLASVIIVIGACAIWFTNLGRLGVANDGLPWYITIGFIGLISASFLKALPHNSLIHRNINEPFQFRESFAVTYLSAAIIIYAMIGYMLSHPTLHKRLPQVVDIQLLSTADEQNRNELLPGMKEHDELRKRRADTTTIAGNPLSQKLSSIKTQPVNPSPKQDSKSTKNTKHQDENTEDKRKEPDRGSQKAKSVFLPTTTTTTSPIVLPGSWSTHSFKTDGKDTTKINENINRAINKEQPYIAEVEPPEMVELMENDGTADAMHVFQAGGQSSGGKGAENDLSAYLKELHRSIKNNWSPPSGNTRRIEVNFRLKRDGHLAFLRISKSSLDQTVDTSALNAIVKATLRGKPLPTAYTHPYLDIAYTFRYNVNELKEVPQEE